MSFTAKENPGSCGAFSCHDFPPFTWHNTSVFLCVLWPWKPVNNFEDCPSVWDPPVFKNKPCLNVLVQSSCGPLSLLPFQGQVSWRTRNHWLSLFAYLPFIPQPLQTGFHLCCSIETVLGKGHQGIPNFAKYRDYVRFPVFSSLCMHLPSESLSKSKVCIFSSKVP